VKQWNNGKQAEYGDRKTFTVPKDADGGRQMTEVRSQKAEDGSPRLMNAASGLSEL
jgi:hypothetical protein